ncbi:MAG: BON domain-containing protein [Myxococcaceae bacterium]
MKTITEEEVVARVLARLEKDLRVNLHAHPLIVSIDRGDLLIEGEVESVAAKKRALEVAAATPGVNGILDRIRVAPSEWMGDGEILSHVIDEFVFESSLVTCGLKAWRRDELITVRPIPPDGRGSITVRVEDGVVTLDGDIPSLTQKRLAESLAWWIPGTRDVVNGLGVEPYEEDSDAEIVDALEVVFDKDPLLKGTRIFATSRERVVTLVGTVRSDAQREAAEEDAWALFGVDCVVNELAVAP